MSKLAKALTAAAGNAGGDNLYVEDVFSTYLYEGNGFYPAGGGQTITNGIDLDGEGGMVWIKARNTDSSHGIYDTERGISQLLGSNLTAQEATDNAMVSANSDGFTLGSESSGWTRINLNGNDYASWTFRKAEKFFDVVTYTGDGVLGRQIAHNLGSVPAVMIVKVTSGTTLGWAVYHQDLGNTRILRLDDSGTGFTNNAYWNSTDPTSEEFTVGNSAYVNGSGNTYVAYLFASDAGGFGDDGSESIIKCGSYTGNGSTDGPEIDLGFEPQWVMIKAATGTTDQWAIFDTMRGLVTGGDDNRLFANLPNAELSGDYVEVNSRGFKPTLGADLVNRNTSDYIYIAIRRPMKTPESGTEVFAAETIGATNGGSLPSYVSGFPVDVLIQARRGVDNHMLLTRLLGETRLFPNLTNAESSETDADFDYQDGAFSNTSVDTNRLGYMFKRATGFFDVVAYTGTGSTAAYQSNLGVPVEFVVVKRRDSVEDWYCWHTSFGQSSVPNIKLNSNAAKSSATLAVWLANPNLANYFWVTGPGNTSGADYISYHFATLAGVSKVGSYTGTGASQNIDCGFSSGARFIMIKRTDSTGDWYVWDSVRGIVAGNDPYLLLNSTAAETTSTDYIDPLSSGFTVTSTAPAALNASGGTYIFLAIA